MHEYKTNVGNKANTQPALFAVFWFQIFFTREHPIKTDPIPTNKLKDCPINSLWPKSEYKIAITQLIKKLLKIGISLTKFKKLFSDHSWALISNLPASPMLSGKMKIS